MIEKLRQRITENPVRYLTLAFVLIIFLMLIAIGARGSTPKNEGDLASPTSGAFIVYKDSPYLPLKQATSNNMLRDDLAYYARSVFPGNYNPVKQPAVVFNVSGEPASNDKSLEFSGGYEKAKGKFRVRVELLNNGRIKTSITNTQTNHNINSELPSNSKQNLFFGSLPINTSNYSIAFSGSGESNKITIRLNELSDEHRKEALGRVAAAAGEDFVNDENISMLYLQTYDDVDRGEFVRIYVSGEPYPTEILSPSADDYEDE